MVDYGPYHFLLDCFEEKSIQGRSLKERKTIKSLMCPVILLTI